jgi:Na+/H+ antiporter NhaD/arsenite permease-like protein
MDHFIVLGAFLFVYLGMMLGNIPGLALDRPGIALLGAIFLLASRSMNTQDAWDAVDVPTMALLFSLMVVSAQFRLAGFYSHVTRKLSVTDVSPSAFLAVLIGVAAILSAVLANDIVCLAMTPVLVEGCKRRELNPTPFLLALACASNVGSAATLIGNPQNMLIGQRLDLSFSRYLFDASVPVILGLGAVWLIIRQRYSGDWYKGGKLIRVLTPRYDRYQTLKGLLVTTCLMVAFLVNTWPRDLVALAAAGILLLSRKMESRKFLGLLDWQLLVLFAALFVLNHALIGSGMLERVMGWLNAAGVNVRAPGWLFILAVITSNLVSNVPATMLLLPVASSPLAGSILALASTFAGNLLIVGSIANLIVLDQAERLDSELRITWREHAKVGVPVTLVTLALAAGWLWFIKGMVPR